MHLTLLSDLETRHGTVARAKATLMQAVPGIIITDISHHVPQGDVQQAAYMLLAAWRHFVPGTVHLVMADAFAATPARMVLLRQDAYWFIAPDNGVLPLALGGNMGVPVLCHEFEVGSSFGEWLQAAAGVLAQLANGEPLHYPEYELLNRPQIMQPKRIADGLECNVLYTDRFGNVVLGITRQQFYDLTGGKFTIKQGKAWEITHISDSYNDVARGKPLCRFNNSGFLEIALNHDKAAVLLGLDTIHAANLRYRTVLIEV